MKNKLFIIDAVAGSGKTTNILNKCDKYKNVLILTYNKRLKNDNITKIQLKNSETIIETFTFH